MNKQKILALMGIIFILSLLAVPIASAALVSSVSFSYYNSGQLFSVNGVFPTSGSGNNGLYYTFNLASDSYLIELQIMVKAYSGFDAGESVVLSAGIQSCSNTLNHAPDDIWLINATNTFNITNAISYPITVPFEFDDEFLAAGNYAIVIWVSSYTGTGMTAAIYASTAGVASGYGGHHGWNNVWDSPVANFDLLYQLYALDGPPATPTPTPTPSPTPEAMPNWISDIIDAIIPIFTPLLVIFICGALGWRFAGAWGFFAGINLAIILVYVIAPTYMPLWAIVAVVIVDIALLFGKVGFDRR